MNKPISVLISLALILGSCSKEEISLVTGDLKGQVYLINQNGYNQFNNFEGVTVTLDGSNQSFITDSTGSFNFNDLKTGTYNILYSKEGYCDCQAQAYAHIGGDYPSTVSLLLFEKEQFDIGLANAFTTETYFDTTMFNLQLEISVSNMEKSYSGLKLYLSNDPEVSYINYDKQFNMDVYNDYSRTFIISLKKSHYPVGSKIYLIAYPARTNYGDHNYLNLETGKKISCLINEDMPSAIQEVLISNIDENE